MEVAAPPAVATFYVHDTGGDIWWRARAPAKQVGANVCVVPNDLAAAAFTEPNTHTPLPWSMIFELDGEVHRANTSRGFTRLANKRTRFKKVRTEFPEHEGTVILTRPSVPQSTLGQWMRETCGVRLITETDDNYFSDANHNLFLRRIKYDERDKEIHASCMWQAHGIVFSTSWLRDRYYRELRDRFGMKGMPDLFVARNHIDFLDWPDPAPRSGPLRVGFMGSTSHVWDVDLAYFAFGAAKAAGATTTMIGYNPANPEPDFDTDRSKASRERMEIWRKVVDTHIPWVESVDYHRPALPLDIGLCPLKHNDFNMGKSDVKAIEYTISGAAVVASNLPVYNESWRHEETCLLVGSAEEMAEATLRLIRDPKLRYELVSNAQEYVREERGSAQMYNEWMAAIA